MVAIKDFAHKILLLAFFGQAPKKVIKKRRPSASSGTMTKRILTASPYFSEFLWRVAKAPAENLWKNSVHPSRASRFAGAYALV